MKSLRLLALLDQLRTARQPVAAAVLAGRLGVSERTIYRDIAGLQALGAPVRGESGLGYQLEQGYFLPPLRFDPEEMEAITLGLRLLMARRGAGLRAPAERVLGKVAAALGAEAGEQFRNLTLLAVARPRVEDAAADDWGTLLRAAIRERRIMALSYRREDGTESRRNIHPLGLTLFDEAWLLTAWCASAAAFRNFRLDRIITLEPTGARFRPLRGRMFRDYLAAL